MSDSNKSSSSKQRKELNEEHIKKLSPFISVALGLFFGLILLFASGYNGFSAYGDLVIGATGNVRRIGNTLAFMTPLIFTGVSVAFAFRTGLFNIGASGQFLIGGFAGVAVGVLLDLPPGIHHLLVILAGALVGAFWGSIPGLLKAFFGIHEVVTSIMLNYTSIWVVQYCVKTFIPGHYETESAVIRESASFKSEFLSSLTNRSSLNYTFFIGILVLVLIYFILEKTTFGFELKAVGFNKNAAKYAGMKVNRNVVFSMAIAGALAGIGGALYYTGYRSNINIGVLPNFGFDGIAVSLLGLNSPIGVFFSALLFGALRGGGEFMSASSGVAKEIVDVVIATIIYFSAISVIMEKFIITKIRSKKLQEPKKAKEPKKVKEPSKKGDK